MNQLKVTGRTLHQLKVTGRLMSQLKVTGRPLQKLKATGRPVNQLKVSADTSASASQDAFKRRQYSVVNIVYIYANRLSRLSLLAPLFLRLSAYECKSFKRMFTHTYVRARTH